jgi:hypothetical protein
VAHAVQLFDSDDSLAADVASFLHRGYLLGEHVRVVSTAAHMAGIARQLSNLGCPVERATATGELVWWDAATTLGSLMSDGRVDAQRLRPLVREMSGNGRPHPTRVYGEMVDLLAERGDLRSALALEQAWTRAIAGGTTSLLCGYQAIHFSDTSTRGALDAICREHDDVRHAPGDDLAGWLLTR